MNNDYLLINELPTKLDVFDTHYSMKYHAPLPGTFDENAHHLIEFNMKPLKTALQQDLQKYHASFIRFHENTFAVIAQDGMYYVFDSHSRSIHLTGVSGEGKIKTKTDNTCDQGADSEECNIVDGMITSSKFAREDCNDSTHDVSSEVEIVEVSGAGVMEFFPLNHESKKALCTMFCLKALHLRSVLCNEECMAMGKPEKIRNITGDGNCFFRAVSFAISGTEGNHV